MWIFLSPHLDDVVFSSGGLVAELTAAGEESAIWTLFAGDPPDDSPLSPFAQQLHAAWEIHERSFAHRRAEDDVACALLGATSRRFQYVDCIYRTDERDGRLLYPAQRNITGPPVFADRGVTRELLEILRDALPPEAHLACPLAIGRHVDHCITRIIAEGLRRPLLYYEDLPYALREPGQQHPGSGWKNEVHSLSAASLAAWQAAAAAYASQIGTNWKTVRDMRAAIEGHVAAAGGVRLWRQDEPSPAARPVDKKAASRVVERESAAKGERGTARGKSLRILLVPQQFRPLSLTGPAAGAQSAMNDMAGALSAKGADVTMVANLSEGKDLQLNGVNYRHLADSRNLKRLLAQLSKQDFAAVHVHHGPALRMAASIFPFAAITIGVTDIFFPIRKINASDVNRYADMAIAVSQFVRSQLVRLGVEEEKIRVIYEGLRTEFFRPDPAVRRDDDLLVFAGATVPGKGADILVSAYGLLVAERPDLRLDVYGSRDMWVAGRQEYMDWPAISARWPGVRHLGARPKADLVAAFNKATLCIVPTDPKNLQEGFTRVSTEAQACGCPVVVSRSGGLPETLIDGETGVIVDPLTPRRLADAIAALLDDGPMRAAMSERAARHAGRYSTDDMARAYKALISAIGTWS